MGTISMSYRTLNVLLLAVAMVMCTIVAIMGPCESKPKVEDSYKCQYESMLLMAEYRPLTLEEFERIEDRLTTWANYNPRFQYTPRQRYDADIRDFSTNGVSIKWNRKLIINNSSQPITLDAE